MARRGRSEALLPATRPITSGVSAFEDPWKIGTLEMFGLEKIADGFDKMHAEVQRDFDKVVLVDGGRQVGETFGPDSIFTYQAAIGAGITWSLGTFVMGQGNVLRLGEGTFLWIGRKGRGDGWARLIYNVGRFDPEQEDEDKCEKHERIHRVLLALLTNLPERALQISRLRRVAPHVSTKILAVFVISDAVSTTINITQMIITIATISRMSAA